MQTRAAVALEAGKPLSIETVELDGPREGEILVEIRATGVCHTDAYTLSGADPEGLFPAILGHEGAGVVVDTGPGVTSLKPGDHVIPLYTPECRQCKFCLSGKTNLCVAIRETQGQGLMPDGTSRFSIGGDKLFHYMGTSTFSNHTVMPEIAAAKVREDAPFDKVCLIGCGVTTGLGAVLNTAKVEPGANVVVFGLGGVGLSVIQGARLSGANMIVGVDINASKAPRAERFGMTHFVNPQEVEGDLVPYLVDLTGRRRGLFLRVHRPRGDHAPGAGMRPSRLGREHRHRRRGVGPGDFHPPLPARHRAGLARHRLRRLQGPARRAEDRGLVHGRQDRDRRHGDPHHGPRRDQRRLRPDARGQVDPQRHPLLTRNPGWEGRGR